MTDISKKIWNEFHKELKNFILKKVKDDDVANDILQDVFMKIIGNEDKISQAKSVQQYVYVMARNAVVDHFRSQSRRNDVENSIDFSEEETNTLNATIADC